MTKNILEILVDLLAENELRVPVEEFQRVLDAQGMDILDAGPTAAAFGFEVVEGWIVMVALAR